jgi:hypothetical protein
MNHPSIPKTRLDVTSENHGILAVCRTMVKKKGSSKQHRAHDMVCTAKQTDVILPMGIAIFRRLHPQLGEDWEDGQERCRNS